VEKAQHQQQLFKIAQRMNIALLGLKLAETINAQLEHTHHTLTLNQSMIAFHVRSANIAYLVGIRLNALKATIVQKEQNMDLNILAPVVSISIQLVLKYWENVNLAA